MPASRLVWAAALALALVAGPGLRPAVAQPRCEEPDDATYLERMRAFPEALQANDYEGIVSLLDWATAHYRYAPHRYARARALQLLERYDEAEAEYGEFLAQFAGCPDPEGLADRARAFRDEVAEYAAVEPPPSSEPITPPPPDPGLRPGAWMAIAGAAIIASGVVYDIANRDLLEERDAARASGDPSRIAAANSSLSTARAVDWALYGVGGAALAVGVVWTLIEPDHEPPPARVTFAPLDGGASWGLAGSF